MYSYIEEREGKKGTRKLKLRWCWDLRAKLGRGETRTPSFPRPCSFRTVLQKFSPTWLPAYTESCEWKGKLPANSEIDLSNLGDDGKIRRRGYSERDEDIQKD